MWVFEEKAVIFFFFFFYVFMGPKKGKHIERRVGLV